MITPEQFDQCWVILRDRAPATLSMNHYDLQTISGIDSQVWKTFLTDENVSEWLEEERKIMRSAELSKLTANVSSSRSVGQAQLISALDRLENNKTDTNVNGPIFIYSYVPLNTEQTHAPNVQLLQEDIFYVNPNNSTGPKFEDTGTPTLSE